MSRNWYAMECSSFSLALITDLLIQPKFSSVNNCFSGYKVNYCKFHLTPSSCTFIPNFLVFPLYISILPRANIRFLIMSLTEVF